MLGHLVGAPVVLEPWWLTVLAGALVWSVATEGWAATVDNILIVGIGMASVAAHECGHALAAHRCRLSVVSINVSPLGGFVRIQRLERATARQQIAVAGAGPATNLALAACFGILLAVGLIGAAPALPDAVERVVFVGAVINLLLAVINLIPIPPLDGGRMLAAWVHRRSPDRRRSAMLDGLSVAAGIGCVVAATAWPGAGPLLRVNLLIVAGALLIHGVSSLATGGRGHQPSVRDRWRRPRRSGPRRSV